VSIREEGFLEVRGYRTRDWASLVRLSAGAFGESVDFWERYYNEEKNPRVDLDLVHVLEEDGEVRASATVLPLEVFVDGRAAPMGGIAAVATHPAYRRRGFAGELMRAVLRTMRERGMHISMLWPFAHAFYRAYGWELAGEAVAYTLRPTDLPTSPEQRGVRAYREEDLLRMMELLDGEAAGYPCCVRRGEERWRGVLAREGWDAAVYEREGRLEGYILYRVSGWREDREPHRTLAVQELVWGTTEGREALISLLAAQDPLVFEITHHTPRGEPLHPYLRSSYVQAKIEPEFMLRLVDVEEALKLLQRAVDEPLVLEVSDDVIEENAGPYTVGKGEVVRGTEADTRVSLDVRQLARLYSGYLPARQLARHGLIDSGSPGALELLEALFPSSDPWVYPPDHF
jgi:predicted acetyltransferase